MKLITLFILSALSLAGAQGALPLVHDTDVAYVGSFRLPGGINGISQFEYGGAAISAYNDSITGAHTLFIGGHPYQEGSMAQVRIPDSLGKGAYGTLPTAAWVQPFANVVDGPVATAAGITTNNGNHLYGSLVYHGRLIVSVGEYYGCTQQRSHGFSTLNLSTGNDFRGFFSIIAPLSNVRSLGGPMTLIPTEWRSAFGGPVIGGMWGTAITSCQSSGPSLTIFNPDSLGMPGNAGVTVAQYPVGNGTGNNHTLCEGAQCNASVPEFETSSIYNMATRYGGLAFPSGTRSVLLFGRQGTGTFCYGLPYPIPAGGGNGVDSYCGFDPPEQDGKGPHAFPYRFQIWAYDANDLLKVKAGTLKTWEVKPYAYWAINDLSQYVTTGHATISGAGYDQATRRLFVTTGYGASPRVDVFKVRELAPVAATPPPVVVPPTARDTIVKRDTVTLIKMDTITLVKVDTVTITKRDTVQDTSFLGERYTVPGLGSVQKIKTSRGVYLVVDMAGMPITVHKVAK